MAQQYDNTNRGVLFTNERKKSEKHPDFTGNINVNGKEWSLSGWRKTGKTGKEFTSLAVSEPRPQPSAPAPQSANEPKEDLPF